jgi:hypothetical protein
MYASGRRLAQYAGAEGPIRIRATEICAVGLYRVEYRTLLNNENQRIHLTIRVVLAVQTLEVFPAFVPTSINSGDNPPDNIMRGRK